MYDRKPQDDSTWSRDYLIPTLRAKYIIDPHGRDAKKSRRLFLVPYDLFVGLVGICKEGGGKIGRLRKLMPQESLFPA